MAWLMASDIIAIRRRMRKFPSKAQALATRMPVSGTARAELMGGPSPLDRAQGQIPALPPAPQPLPDEPTRRGEKEREEDDHGQHQHDRPVEVPPE